MKILKREKWQCTAIVQPGEYVHDLWANEQCGITSISQLVRCEHCGKLFCLMSHYHPHLDSIAQEMSSDAT